MSQMSVVPVDDPRGLPAAPAGPPATALTFLQPVPRALVHRSAVAEVFVTDGVRTGGTSFAVAAQWPRDHALYHPDSSGQSDPLLFAETIRQALLYISHTHFDIPAGHRFVGRDIRFEITDPAALRVAGAPVPVVLEVDWSWEVRRAAHRAGARLQVRLLADGRPCGHGSLRSLIVDDRLYGLLRGAPREAPPAAAPPPGALAPPHRVGRLRWKDCVLEPLPGGEWQLRLDRDHAVLFDHPTDHVPMMAMLEGFRQLGHLTVHEQAPPHPCGPRAFALVGAAVDCAAFGELDEPIRLVPEDCPPGPAPAGGRRLRTAAFQGGRLLARADTTWADAGPRTAAAVPFAR
jgi:2-oxo-3-(phosphooxy)propyl 3-oxoalkanoate synthase